MNKVVDDKDFALVLPTSVALSNGVQKALPDNARFTDELLAEFVNSRTGHQFKAEDVQVIYGIRCDDSDYICATFGSGISAVEFRALRSEIDRWREERVKKTTAPATWIEVWDKIFGVTGDSSKPDVPAQTPNPFYQKKIGTGLE